MSRDHPPFRSKRVRSAGEPLKVLIIDDDRDIAQSLKEAVEDLGDTAQVGFNGGEAVTLALSSEPDVLLLDLSLPDLSGLKVAEALRSAIRSSALK